DDVVVAAQSLELDRGLEVALGLQQVLQVAGAFGEQVHVHQALLEDRDVAPELLIGEVIAVHADDDLRAAPDVDDQVDADVVRVEVAADHLHFGLPKTGLVELSAQLGDALFQARVGGLAAPLPTGDRTQALFGEAGVAGEQDVAEGGPV